MKTKKNILVCCGWLSVDENYGEKRERKCFKIAHNHLLLFIVYFNIKHTYIIPTKDR